MGNYISKIFGASPVGPIQEHMELCYKSTKALISFFEHVIEGDWTKVEQDRSEIVTLENDDPDYYEAPAPGWDWGNRFSRSSFDRALRERVTGIVDTHFNLLANRSPVSQGCVYYLIDKQADAEAES